MNFIRVARARHPGGNGDEPPLIRQVWLIKVSHLIPLLGKVRGYKEGWEEA